MRNLEERRETVQEPPKRKALFPQNAGEQPVVFLFALTFWFLSRTAAGIAPQARGIGAVAMLREVSWRHTAGIVLLKWSACF